MSEPVATPSPSPTVLRARARAAGDLQGVIVMATYNEAGSITSVLGEVIEAVHRLEPQGIELGVLLVDDNSPDGTADIAREVARKSGLRLSVLSGDKSGLGAALVRGFRHVLRPDATFRPDFIVTLDADGQHDARQIPGLVEAFLSRGSGVMIGSRWTPGGSSPGTSRVRMVLSRGGNLMFRIITGTRDVKDATTSFRVIRPEVAELFDPERLRVDGYAFFSAFIALAQANGHHVHESPIVFRPRSAGLSKLSLADCVEFFVNLFAVRRVARAARRGRQPAFQAPDTSADFGAASELERLSEAKRFNRWIADLLTPALGSRVLDVGAGIAAVTRLLATKPGVQSVVAIEPAANLFPKLQQAVEGSTVIAARQVTTGQLVDQDAGTFDSVTYVNVLEHIEHDEDELKVAASLLTAGGRIGVFVPAAPWLYGSMDRLSGHHRRYTRRSLCDVAERAGFTVEDIRYADVVSMLPYWFMYRVLKVEKLGTGSGVAFDSVLVPVSKVVQRLVPRPPFGKNLVLIARKR